MHGYETQIEEYIKAEKPNYSFFVIINVGASKGFLTKIDKLIKRNLSNKFSPEVITIDARKKVSASKFK
jgi:hypothetical protein